MSEFEPPVPLDLCDPGESDPGYWDRFQRAAMQRAAGRLEARRRMRATMGGVVVSWSRLVLPPALAAAAAAAALLLVPDAPEGAAAPELEVIAGVEEVLQLPRDGEEPLPAFLHTDAAVDRDVVLFTVEGF